MTLLHFQRNPECPKCGFWDVTRKYETTRGEMRDSESLVCKCGACGFAWRTMTKDAR